jgi:hypothetical protein
MQGLIRSLGTSRVVNWASARAPEGRNLPRDYTLVSDHTAISEWFLQEITFLAKSAYHLPALSNFFYSDGTSAPGPMTT